MQYGNMSSNPPQDASIVGSERLSLITAFLFTNFFKIIAVIFVAIMLYTSVYKVDTEERAVILRLGKYSKTTEPGLHFMLPFGIDRAILVKTERIMKEEFGFRSRVRTGRTSYLPTEAYDIESLVLTGDLNVSNLEWIVQYKIDDARKFLFNLNDPVGTIRDISEAVTRMAVGDATVSDVLTTERADLALKIHNELQRILNTYDMGVRIVTVKFQDVNPPSPVRAAFNGVNEAEQQKESLILQAREQYNKEVPKARGEARKTVQEAEGYALERVNLAEGEAKRFLAVLSEYLKFPEVTKKRLYLETIERVAGRVQDITIIDGVGGKGELLPVLPLRPFYDGAKTGAAK